jgi:hypothetical protein
LAKQLARIDVKHDQKNYIQRIHVSIVRILFLSAVFLVETVLGFLVGWWAPFFKEFIALLYVIPLVYPALIEWAWWRVFLTKILDWETSIDSLVERHVTLVNAVRVFNAGIQWILRLINQVFEKQVDSYQQVPDVISEVFTPPSLSTVVSVVGNVQKIFGEAEREARRESTRLILEEIDESEPDERIPSPYKRFQLNIDASQYNNAAAVKVVKKAFVKDVSSTATLIAEPLSTSNVKRSTRKRV